LIVRVKRATSRAWKQDWWVAEEPAFPGHTPTPFLADATHFPKR
jgi:hypothetical protein